LFCSGGLPKGSNKTAIDIGKTLCVFTPAVCRGFHPQQTARVIFDTDSASDLRYLQRESAKPTGPLTAILPAAG
jgi:hypothetical protein